MAILQITVDDSLLNDASLVAREMGLDLPTTLRMFLLQMVKDNGLPFQPSNEPGRTARTSEPAFSLEQLEQLKASQSAINPFEAIERLVKENGED